MATDYCIDNILVLEIADGWSAGAVAGRLLSELGARVLKLEPLEGDRLRHIGPGSTGPSSQFFSCLNTNKESLVLDLTEDSGLTALSAMLGSSDVLLTDQTTLDDRAPGLDFEAFTKQNTGLIHCHFSPFGLSGPLKKEKGGDLIAQAMGGIIATTGHPGELPHKAGPPLAVHNGALMGGASILAALYDRAETGKGALIDMSLYDGMISLIYTFIPGYFISGKAPGPQGNQHPMAAPWDNYPTKDGWVIVCMADDRQWQNFLKLIGKPELANDPRFKTNDERVTGENRPLVNQLVIDFLADKPTEEALKVLTEGEIPAGPIYNVFELIEDPQFLAREMVQTFRDGSENTYRTPGSIFKMTETPGQIYRPAPSLDEHEETPL